MVFISWVIPATRWRWPSNIFFKVTLNKGDNYTLRCSAQGQPNPRVSWSRRSGAELVRGYFKTFWMKRLTYLWSVGYNFDFDTFYPKKVQILTGFSLKSVNLDTFPLLRVIIGWNFFTPGKKDFWQNIHLWIQFTFQLWKNWGKSLDQLWSGVTITSGHQSVNGLSLQLTNVDRQVSVLIFLVSVDTQQQSGLRCLFLTFCEKSFLLYPKDLYFSVFSIFLFIIYSELK